MRSRSNTLADRWRQEDPPATGNDDQGGFGAQLPGPRFLAGAYAFAMLYEPLRFFAYCQKRYGDVFVLPFGTALPRNAWVCNPALAQQIMLAPAEELEAGDANAIVGPLVGSSSLLLLKGSDHDERRQLLTAEFDPKRLELDRALFDTALQSHLASWRAGQELPLWKWTRALTIEIMLGVVFGITRGADFDALAAGINEVIDLSNNIAILMPRLRRDLGPLSPWGRFLRGMAKVDELLYREIALRRRDPALASRHDILSLALQVKYGPREASLSDADLRDEMMTLIIAGNQTAAGGFAWTLELLLRNLDKLTALRADLEKGGTDYLKYVVWEGLRLRVPLFAIGRRAVKDYTLGRFVIPEGMAVAVPLPVVYRSPNLYKPDPTAFRPERYREGAPRPQWVPFGDGIRRCIGKDFAPLMIGELLRGILERFELRLADTRAERVKLMSGALLVPSREVPLRITAQHEPPASA